MRFEFATATRIVFGRERIREAAPAAASYGGRALIVSGGTPARLESLREDLHAHGVETTVHSVRSEPTIPGTLEGVRAAQSAEAEVIIGFGGGSVLDSAKAIAALLTNPGDPLDYMEVVGRGNPLIHPCAPCICIPTTAGTGSEVTRNAVLVSPEHRVKVSLRSPKMFPVLAIIDPDLTLSLPPAVTASTGMDALAQLIEPFTSKAANPLTDALCRQGILNAALWLKPACQDGANPEARENMALASLFGGIALANAGLGAVHGIAAPLGGARRVPHGIVCARLLPEVIRTNIQALRLRANNSTAMERYDEIARLLTGSDSAKAEHGVEWLRTMCTELGIPSFSDYGLTQEDLPSIAAHALKSSSMKGNPIQLTIEEVTGILMKTL